MQSLSTTREDLAEYTFFVKMFDCTQEQFVQNLLPNAVLEIAQNLSPPTYPSSLIPSL